MDENQVPQNSQAAERNDSAELSMESSDLPPGPDIPDPNDDIDIKKENTLILVFIGILFLVLSVATGLYGYMILSKAPMPEKTNIAPTKVVDQGSGSSIRTTTEFPDNYAIMVSGDLTRNADGYEFNEKIYPAVIDTELAENNIKSSLDNAASKETLYKIEVIEGQEVTATYYLTATYCPPATDVCETVKNEEIPVGSGGYISPLMVPINEFITQLRISLAGNTVKTIVRRQNELEIANIKTSEDQVKVNEELRDVLMLNYDINSDIDNKLWVTIEYQDTSNSWRAYSFGEYSQLKSIQLDPDSFYSTTSTMSFRLTVTDGFNFETKVLHDLLPLGKKEIESIRISNIIEEAWVGQNTNFDLDFVDPESGAGCDGSGCSRGPNAGKYQVTWFSNMQNICEEDIYNGTLMYKFKKEGIHKIGARVEHSEKPELNAEVVKEVTVHEGDLLQDQNPNCSS